MNARCIGVLFSCLLALAGCSKHEDRGYQGWVEADLIFVSPDEAGRVDTLSVREGQTVETGEPLFAVEPELQQADVEMARAALTNATQAFDRAQALYKTSTGTQKSLEDAEATLRTAQARFNSAQTRLSRRKMFSPVNGTIQQIYFRPGELVPAARPVVALLPPGNIKIRFFVPETLLATIAIGNDITVHCDGCKSEVAAKVTFISRSAEFTPPVIYSLDERSKLVYLIEARTGTPGDLRIGQPVDVRFAEAGK